MRDTVLIFCLMMAMAACKPITENTEEKVAVNVSAGKIDRIEQFPSKLVDPRTVDIWLPEGFDPEQEYPVLYMHDGQMLFDASTTWNKQEWGVDETIDSLVEKGKVPPMIVVGIWNNGAFRHSEYFPQKPFEQLPEHYRDDLLNHAVRGGDQPLFAGPVASDGYLAFLVTELKPYIDQTYPTKTGPSHTFVAGASMGGLISIYALCEYPSVFGGAACLSTHWPGAFSSDDNPIPKTFVDYLAENLPEPGKHLIYFDYGTETLDAVYEPHQQAVDRIMRRRGYGPETWQSRKFTGADHSEHAWRARLSIPLEFLLGNR